VLAAGRDQVLLHLQFTLPLPCLLFNCCSLLAGVEDFGLGRLCSLTGLTALNLAATGIHFTDEAVMQALSQLGRLARLRLDR
jgi:hypothetical protein